MNAKRNGNTLPTQPFIYIKGARQHNLKNIDVAIPRNQLIVITGVSGSGKSSLAYNTLYAEGQRRYIESLSAYARQFLGKIEKPKVDYIKGISPAIAVEQKANTHNPRSTVGTATEIYDYLKLLFSRIGKTFSPVSNQEVKRHTMEDVMHYIHSLTQNTKVSLFAPLQLKEARIWEQQLTILQQQGFSRILFENNLFTIEELLQNKTCSSLLHSSPTTPLALLIDRFVVKQKDKDNQSRIADSIESAFHEGEGELFIEYIRADNNAATSEKVPFSNRFELDGITFEEPSTHFFSFNNPLGACKTCEGFGSIIGIDEELVVPNKSLSVFDEAIVCWKGEKMSKWKEQLILKSNLFNFPIHRPYHDLTSEEKKVLWTGNKHFHGINDFFTYVESQSHKIQYRVMLSRYRGKTICPDCKGTRIRKDTANVKIDGYSLQDIVLMSVEQLYRVFQSVSLNEQDSIIAKRLLTEINNRLQYLNDVGLGYLTLNRLASTLSGGESQRINLATYMGSSLVGSMYILDEPSIGLHTKDTHRLIKVLQSLKELGNTVIVVEHDEEIMRAADQIIDLGPMAGTQGGEVVFQGNVNDNLKNENSLTLQYLQGGKTIPLPAQRRKWNDYIEIVGARENNLKAFNVKFPLHIITVVTGVSGSGKSSLINRILYPALRRKLEMHSERVGLYNELRGNTSKINDIQLIDQKPIGRSSRSNPVTYIKGYDEIRSLFAKQQLSHIRGYTATHFSFNVDGGRCETCQGEGEITVEMQFMADVHLVCDDCQGKRFKEEVLEVKYNEKNIAEVLDLTVDDAIVFFSAPVQHSNKKIIEKLLPLQNVGLGYIRLGQSSSTLSGGEAQRIKLASFLGNHKTDQHILFLFDEPTTGLHFHDINKLMDSFNALVKQGHTLIIIEHNMEIIKNADWLIDLGPEGGDKGGHIVFEGTPEEIIKCKESYTGTFLQNKLLNLKPN